MFSSGSTLCLLKNIHNAPASEKLTLEDTAINVDNLEILHAAVPRLKELTSYSVYQTKINGIILKYPAQHLQSFSIIIDSQADNVAKPADDIFRWLSYIQEKYQCVSRLIVSDDCGALGISYSFHQKAVVEAMKCMINLESYTTDVYPQFTCDILTAMEGNGIHLKYAKVCLEIVRQSDQQFHFLQNSSSTQTLEHLNIEVSSGYYNIDMLSLLKRRLPELCNNSTRMTHLTVKYRDYQDQDLLGSIILTVNTLESLSFSLNLDNLYENKVDTLSVQHINGNIKKLDLYIRASTIFGRPNMLYKADSTLYYIFQSF